MNDDVIVDDRIDDAQGRMVAARFSVSLDGGLHRELRRLAQYNDRTLGGEIRAALRWWVKNGAKGALCEPLRDE